MLSTRLVLFTALVCASIMHVQSKVDQQTAEQRVARNCSEVTEMKKDPKFAGLAASGIKLFCPPNDLTAAKAFFACDQVDFKEERMWQICQSSLNTCRPCTTVPPYCMRLSDLITVQKCSVVNQAKHCGGEGAKKILAWELEKVHVLRPDHMPSHLRKCKDELVKEMQKIYA